MPSKSVEGPQSLKSMQARAPQIKHVCRQLASLALAQVQQDGLLSVRQREQVRREIATAGDALGWTAWADGTGDSVAGVGKDIMTMAKSGARAMARDLAAELVSKKKEIAQIRRTAKSAQDLAQNKKTVYPAEITYSFTARDPSGDLITKTETLTMEDAEEALSAAATIEKNITARGKWTDLMILDLKRKQKQLDVMAKTLSDFIESSQDLMQDVIANLQ